MLVVNTPYRPAIPQGMSFSTAKRSYSEKSLPETELEQKDGLTKHLYLDNAHIIQ